MIKCTLRYYPMPNFTSRRFPNKQGISLFFFQWLLLFAPLSLLAQEVVPTFKITGAKRVDVFSAGVNQRAVEYDPYNADHLFISFFGPGDVLLKKAQYKFKGKKFNLTYLQDHLSEKELLRDGLHTVFSANQSVAAEMIYMNDTLREQTYYYPNGAKQMTLSGDENTLNGEFTMWHPNGTISFLGRYKNNVKHGEFKSFDESGTLERKGVYESGKLISGESVVQDLVYDTPEVPAQPADGIEAFNEYLKTKTVDLAAVKQIKEGIVKEFFLHLTLDKKGHIHKMEISIVLSPLEVEIVNTAFKRFQGFKPALMEGAPVRSILKLPLILSNQGLQASIPVNGETDLNTGPIYFITEEMPEFPGGIENLRLFVAKNINYPAEAQELAIQGKVYVSFVILEDGSIVNVKIVRSVHPALDAEAIRVVQSMPRWKPGRQGGKSVRVSYTIPINFLIG